MTPEESDQIEAIRRGTPVVMSLRMKTSDSEQSYNFYIYESSVMAERVNPDGTDDHIMVATDDLPEHLADLLDPLHTAGEHREVGRFATMDDFADQAAQFPVLAETVVLSMLTLADKRTDLARACVVYASPHAVAILDGGPTLTTPDTPYVLSEASRDDVLDAVNHLIAGVPLPSD